MKFGLKALFSISFLVLFILITIFSNDLLAADKDNISVKFNKGLITISAKNAPIEDVLTAIAKKSDIVFDYAKGSLNKKVTINTVDSPAKDAIKQMFRDCGIKNYTIETGENNIVESVEIFATLKSSPYTPPPAARTKETEPVFPEEEVVEEEEDDDSKPRIATRRRKVPEAAATAVVAEEAQEAEEKEEETTDVKEEAGSKTIVIKGKDASSEYAPPGSTSSTSTRETPKIELLPDGTLPDMSEHYHPPGYVKDENKTDTSDRPVYDGENLPDMSEHYHPPGYTP